MAGDRLQALLKRVAHYVEEIDVHQLKQKLSSGDVLLIDVREEKEWCESHIPGAIHISKGMLECKIEKVCNDSSQEILLHCGGGVRSLLAAYALHQMGYQHVISVVGGFGAWIESGYKLSKA